MLTRQTLYVAFVIDLCLLLLAAWLLNTSPVERTIRKASGWAALTRIGWRVARRVGAWAIDTELRYYQEIEKAKS